jgi:hypothetical protein
VQVSSSWRHGAGPSLSQLGTLLHLGCSVVFVPPRSQSLERNRASALDWARTANANIVVDTLCDSRSICLVPATSAAILFGRQLSCQPFSDAAAVCAPVWLRGIELSSRTLMDNFHHDDD